MPKGRTYDIKCIDALIRQYVKDGVYSIDPFSNKSRIASVTNDLDPEVNSDYNLDAFDFLNMFEKDSIDVVLFDPPYSSRQVSECYKKFGMTVDMETTQSSYWSRMKKQISHILKPNGVCISFGWNTNGIGQKLGFELIEILLVAHGGAHNDTLVTVERKIQTKLF